MITPYIWLVVKLMIGFSFIITYFYLTGKHQLNSMTPIDFIGNFIIGGVVGGVIYSDSIPIPTYITTLIMALSVVYIISAISDRFSMAKAVTMGIPLVLIQKGQFCHSVIKEHQSKINFENILRQLHLQGIARFDEIDYLRLEPTGDVIATKKGDELPSVIIYEDKGFIAFNLERLSLKEETVQAELDKQRLTDVVLIEYWNGSMTVITERGKRDIALQ